MKLLRLAPENTKFGFMRFRRVSYPLSATLSIVSVLMFLFVGMNFGIDFAGGTQVDMRAKSGEAHVAELRAKAESLGLGPVEVQRIGARRPTCCCGSTCSPAATPGEQTAIAKLREAFANDYEVPQRRLRSGRASPPNWCRAARSASSSPSSRC